MDVVSYAMGEGAGYSKGYSAGYDDGLDANAYQEGYDAGETAGYNSGYSAGYDEGVASVNSVKALIDARGADNLFNANASNGSKLLTNEQLTNILKYNDTENATSAVSMFCEQSNLTSIPTFNTANITRMNLMFGCSAGNKNPCFFNGGNAPLLNTSKVENIYYMFGSKGNVSKVESIPLYDFKKVTNATGLFCNCRNIKIIPAFNFSSLPTNYADFNVITSGGWIYNCIDIEEIHIVDIHYNMNIKASTKFTREALNEIIGNLRDMTGSATAKTLTMGATNMAKLTADDIAVATGKNWTIA